MLSSSRKTIRSRAQTVLYAKSLGSLRTFYQGMFLLKLEHEEPDFAVLASSFSQLIIVQVPDSIASTIHIADPPERRTETPIKMVFEVQDLAASRDAAPGLGGQIDPPEREWTFQGSRVCDGQDPEGNVVQFRQRGRPSRAP